MSQFQITCETPGAEIYYSLNNTSLNQLYTNPIQIETETTINAVGKLNGYIDSEVSIYKVEEILPKLPTPQGDIERVGRIYTLTILNFDEYPAGTVFHYSSDGGSGFTGSTHDMGENSLAYGLYASCEGYEDSDTVDVSWMPFKLFQK